MKFIVFITLIWPVLATAYPITVTDSNGKVTFKQAPQRVVVLNHTLAEQLLSLGVEPIALADVARYQKNIKLPSLPDQVVDVGDLMSPDFNKLRELKPDLIVVGYSQRPLMRAMSNIAPLLYFNNFSRRYHNANKADERLITLATVFDKQEAAQRVLKERDHRIEQLKHQIKTLIPQAPQITVAVIENDDAAWVFGNNSMVEHVLNLLDLPLATETQPSKLGSHKLATQELLNRPGCVLFMSFDGFDAAQSPAWQQSVAHQNGCLLAMPLTSLYGGSESLAHLAEAITEVLLSNITTVR